MANKTATTITPYLLPQDTSKSQLNLDIITVHTEVLEGASFDQQPQCVLLDAKNNVVTPEEMAKRVSDVNMDKYKTVSIAGEVSEASDIALDTIGHQLSKAAALFASMGITTTEGGEEFIAEAMTNSVSEKQLEANQKLIDYAKKAVVKLKLNITTMLPLALQANKHLLIAGPAGHGKTYEVTRWAATTGRKVLQVTMHPGVEATDILGAPTIAMDKSLVWVDGMLARAFRLARAGQKVVLIVDEILRMPARELSIFVGALTPDSTGHYHLNTGKVITDNDGNPILFEGAAETEEIVCPMENLFVVATTNRGANYDVADGDTAFNDRFLHYFHELTDTQLEVIVANELHAKIGNKAKAKNVAKSITKVNSKFKEMVKDGDLKGVLTLRHISEAINAITDLSELNLHLSLKFPLLVDNKTNGAPDDVQLGRLATILNKFLG